MDFRRRRGGLFLLLAGRAKSRNLFKLNQNEKNKKKVLIILIVLIGINILI